MGDFLFDDSKDLDCDDEFDLPEPLYRPAISPGKITRTSRLVSARAKRVENRRSASLSPTASSPVQRKSQPTKEALEAWTEAAFRPDIGRAPAQRHDRSKAARRAESSADIQRAAGAGVRGMGTELPHARAIQRAFGAYDISGVRAHIGGPAQDACREIGATAYATGSDIAFRESPDLHTAAHEVAHIVQQRAGVQLGGGVGQAGDAYERHADRVADIVVASGDAEPVLREMAPDDGIGAGKGEGTGATRGVQMNFDELAAAVSPASAERPNSRTPSPRQNAVHALTAWCRANLPDRARLDQFLDGITQAGHAEAIQITGQLAREIARMEFLLGDLYHEGERNWERGRRHDGTRAGRDQGEFVDTYQEASGAEDGAWCTKFAGYAYSRLDEAALGDNDTRFWSGYRVQSWAADNGAERMSSADFRAHKRALQGISGADAAAQRGQLADAFVSEHGGPPQPGEVLIVTRSTARRRNDDGTAAASGSARYDGRFTRRITRENEDGETETVQGGGLSHTVMVDAYDAATRRISTIEGNAGNAVTGRQFDLSVAESEGGVDGVGRMIALVQMDPAVFRNGLSHDGGEGQTPVSDETLEIGRTLVGEIQAVNQRLAEISIELDAIEGAADGTVNEWEHGDSAAGDISES